MATWMLCQERVINWEGAPHEIDTVVDYQRLGPILSERGYSDEDVAKIMYRNWQRFYQEHLPAN